MSTWEVNLSIIEMDWKFVERKARGWKRDAKKQRKEGK